MGDQVTTARPATATPARIRRPPLHWLRPRGVVRGRRALEHNRVYDAAVTDSWVPERAGTTPADRTTSLTGSAGWWLRHQWRTVAVDCSVVVVAALLGTVVIIGDPAAGSVVGLAGGSSPGRTLWALAIAATWLVVLALTEIWSVPALRSGQATTRLLVRSAAVVFVAFGVLAYLTSSDDLRSFLLLSVPLGLAGLAVARIVLQGHVRRLRVAGALPSLVLVVGPETGPAARLPTWVADFWGTATMVRVPDVDATTPGQRPADDEHLADRIRAVRADLVVLTEPERFTPGRIAELAWIALGVGTDLVVPAPATGGRAAETTATAVRLVGGDAPRPGVPELGLIAVDPRRPRAVRATRVVVDWLLAAVALVLLLPVVMIATLAVAIAEGPPVFVDTERIGRDGVIFRVWSFRCVSSTPGAARDSRRTAGGPVPHLTRVGGVLRRTGIEGIPGLFNVLSGDLALVGPCPATPAVGMQRSPTPWLRPGLTGRWRDPGMDAPPGADGESWFRDLQVLVRIVIRRLAGRMNPAAGQAER